MLGAELANLKTGDNQYKVDAEAPTSNTQAGRLLKVSKNSIKRAKTVKNKGTPELVEAVKTGEIGVTPAAEIAKLPPDQQNAALKLRASRPNVSKAPKATTVEKLNSLAGRTLASTNVVGSSVASASSHYGRRCHYRIAAA